MLIALFVLLFGLQQRANCITAKSAHQDDTVIKLEDLIKKDLRRNNDDYIDKFNNSKVGEVALNKQSGADNVAKTNVKQQSADVSLNKPNQMFLGKNANRRRIDFSDEINYNKYSYSPVTVTSDPSLVGQTANPKRYQKVKTVNEFDPGSLSPRDANPEYVKKDKIDQFRQFMNKNKDLIQEFINNKREEVHATEPLPVPGLRAHSERVDEDMAPRTQASEERVGAKAEPRQLDMSPAKGGRIHSMRIKGRLCDRSVLVPEGPKYDSKGLVYLAAFRGGRRDYAETSPPKLLLPRCCNCCRKSVLGCE